MVLLQSTRMISMTSLRLVMASSGQEESAVDDKELREELEQGLEELMQDNQGSIQELLDSDLLSNSQVVSVFVLTR